ncbi:hypothetical protein K505DRAFT_323082 [Melanomma pulvis-pyrius CBS 109.77]|uniref:Secreted protein n=1 Tax=Melanomma pulvis-pyrius CBS 109.77 TaxID=1314802 RepID=A0A6A6XLH5_9PLEO|nr:hypothetical protein K505DRAFT_323082 [Melanomma pulvis-pyrius CBS 109.77]
MMAFCLGLCWVGRCWLQRAAFLRLRFWAGLVSASVSRGGPTRPVGRLVYTTAQSWTHRLCKSSSSGWKSLQGARGCFRESPHGRGASSWAPLPTVHSLVFRNAGIQRY